MSSFLNQMHWFGNGSPFEPDHEGAFHFILKGFGFCLLFEALVDTEAVATSAKCFTHVLGLYYQCFHLFPSASGSISALCLSIAQAVLSGFGSPFLLLRLSFD